jgi:hypothetical protein
MLSYNKFMTSPKGNSHREPASGLQSPQYHAIEYLRVAKRLGMQPTTTLKRNLPIWVLNRPEKKS